MFPMLIPHKGELQSTEAFTNVCFSIPVCGIKSNSATFKEMLQGLYLFSIFTFHFVIVTHFCTHLCFYIQCDFFPIS